MDVIVIKSSDMWIQKGEKLRRKATVARKGEERPGETGQGEESSLSSLSSESSSELEVLGLDGDSLGVDGAQVGVLEERDEVCLRGFLESHDGAGEGRIRDKEGAEVSEGR
jgi:hypothetical protein